MNGKKAKNSMRKAKSGEGVGSYYAKPPLKVRLKDELVFWLQMLVFAFVVIMSIDLVKFVDGKKWEYYNWIFVLGCIVGFIIWADVSQTNKNRGKK